ncbi:TetR family transcriptional regulator [Lysinibacillus sp. KCTC 33748]|uniref:TetR/AcrR family transcriptional regulator n=1 Tax=unclassified Lysinibacillus TaxID=2636778 RepID=UPI0009A73F99|nr:MULTISPECIES: TetR/AcrR family transcriptional regulator [unclassified Lysinibacillus]OXS66931.1 TetR family transcriptional regulator [Lysinibacillus sp. KCTC 33748]SKC16689.1 transcriptional regulator, TetR family [Lysinibacillus sp. AC-3]
MDRRQEILEAATKSFTLFGYKATTMEQVAKIANVGKGTIYTFFANKEILFQEIAMSLVREMQAEADAVLDASASFMDNAHNALMRMLHFREKHLLFAKLLEEEKELRTPAVKQALVRIENEILSYVTELIQRRIVKGEIRDCDAELVSFLLLKAYLAFVVDWHELHGEIIPEEKILNLFKETIFRGLILT